jgi:hypothetical protein
MCESSLEDHIASIELELNDIRIKKSELELREDQLNQKLQQLKIQQLQEADTTPGTSNFAGIKCGKCGCNLPLDDDAIEKHGAVCKVRLHGGGHKIPIGLVGFGSGPGEEAKPSIKLDSMALSPSTLLSAASYFGELREKHMYSPQKPTSQSSLDGLRQHHIDETAAYTWDSGQANNYQGLPQDDQSKREERRLARLEVERQKLEEARIQQALQDNIQLETDLPLPPPKPPKRDKAAASVVVAGQSLAADPRVIASSPQEPTRGRAGKKSSATTVSAVAEQAAKTAEADDIL